jgi:hypothetical protein
MTAAEIEAQLRRVERAREIASHPDEIEKIEDGAWSVPSQVTLGRYCVRLDGGKRRCTCPDY